MFISDLFETTGDRPFDNMMKGIAKGAKKQATADRKQQKQQDQERARAAFGNMFGGGNPADQLSIRKKDDIAENTGGLNNLNNVLWQAVTGQSMAEAQLDEIDPGIATNFMAVFPTISKIIVTNALTKARKEAKETSSMVATMKKYANGQPVTPEENEQMATQFKDLVSYGLISVAAAMTGGAAGPAAGAGVALAGAYKKEILELIKTKGPAVLIGLLKDKGKLDVVQTLSHSLLGKHALPFYPTPKNVAEDDVNEIFGFQAPKPAAKKSTASLSQMRKEFEKDPKHPLPNVKQNKHADELRGRVHVRRTDEEDDGAWPFQQVNELSNDTLSSYKKKAGADASAADQAGDTKKADQRFSGIVRATKKQFANDAKQGVSESEQLSVQQLATISDEALDKAYGYGRSTPGNSFGWQANLKSAAYAKQMIDKGVTDIEAISDAIHKGWNVTAQAFVQNPEQFDDTAKLQAAGKLEAKLQQRAKLMNIGYAQLPDEEQEKDRVVARALLQALKGPEGVAEAGKGISKDAETKFHAKLDTLVHDTFGKRDSEQGVAEGMEESNLYAMALQKYPQLKQVNRETVINALNNAYEDYLMHYGYEGIGPDEESSMIDHVVKGLKQGVAEAGFPGAPDVEMPPMKPSGDPQRDKLKQEYMDLHSEIKSLVDIPYSSDSSPKQKMQAKARIKQLNDRADQIKAILEPRQPPNEWQKKTYGYDDNWNIVKKGVAEQGYGNHPSQRVDPRTGKKYVPPKSPLGQGVAEETMNEGVPSDNDMGIVPDVRSGTSTKMTLGQWKQMWLKKMPHADQGMFRYPPAMNGSFIAYFDGWENTPGARWDPMQSMEEEKQRLDTKCWTGKKIGNPKTKVKGGVRVNNCVPAESMNEFAPPGGSDGDSGRWYTDDELADIIGDDWFEDFDVSHDEFNIDAYGEKAKQNLASYANSWFDDRGYNVNVMGVDHNDVDHDLKWYIVGSFHNPNFADKDIEEDQWTGSDNQWHSEEGDSWKGSNNQWHESAESGPVECHGYAYNNRDQRIMFTKVFPSEQAAKTWANKRNATILDCRPSKSQHEDSNMPVATDSTSPIGGKIDEDYELYLDDYLAEMRQDGYEV